MAADEIDEEYFYSEKQIWDVPFDLWPHRIHTKPITYIENLENGIFIKDMWDRLEFIKNKVKWGSQVQGSFRRLSEHEYDVIYQKIREQRA